MAKVKNTHEEYVQALVEAYSKGWEGTDATEYARNLTGYDGRVYGGWHRRARKLAGLPVNLPTHAKETKARGLRSVEDPVQDATEANGYADVYIADELARMEKWFRSLAAERDALKEHLDKILTAVKGEEE